MKKLMILGHARHGKDTVAEIIADYKKIKHRPSSWYIARNIVYPILADKYGYQSTIECFQDRANHRKEWQQIIDDVCGDDSALVIRMVLKNQDIYTGCRNINQYFKAKEESLFDYTIWVNGFSRAFEDPTMKITSDVADYIIYNDGTLYELKKKVYKMINELGI